MRPKAEFSSVSVIPFAHFIVQNILRLFFHRQSVNGPIQEQSNLMARPSKRRSGRLLCAFYTQVLFVLESRLALILLVSSVIIVSPFEAAGSAIGTGGGMDSSSS